jgi:hypothetical protein
MHSAYAFAAIILKVDIDRCTVTIELAVKWIRFDLVQRSLLRSAESA